MKQCFHMILFIGMLLMFTSCKTTEASKTISTLNAQPPGYTLLICIPDNGNTRGMVMDKVHQFCSPAEVQFDTNSNFMYQESEIQIKITSVPDRQINEIRNALNTIAGVIMVYVSKN